MNPESPPNKSQLTRVLIIAGFLFGLFTLLIGQFFRIQIFEGDDWTKKADRQHFFDVTEPFIRGSFYSNAACKKGHPELWQKFAFDIQKYHLYIDPESIPEGKKNEIAHKILSITNPEDKEKSGLREQFDKVSRSRKVVSWMSEETKTTLLRWWFGYAKKNKIESNALFVVGDTLRSHPFGKLAGQTLHTIQIKKDEVSQKSYPTGGLELSCDPFLRGRVGKRRLARSPRHELETNQVIVAPQHGSDVYLTINHCLQAICEEELEKGVRASKARCGWAVMMDPFTGEILALAQYPFFYPDQYESYFNNKEKIEDTKIKAITDANEPGSVMKAMTIACALKANKVLRGQGKKELFSPAEKIDTSHGSFPGRGKALTDTHFHHWLNMNMGIQKSSNIYAATLASRIVKTLGNEWYRHELETTFGLGKKTGIELPSESAGVLPTPGKKHPNGKLEWSIPTPYSLAMGHNVQVTSLQLARVFAVFANGGTLVTPTMIRKIVKDGETIVDNTQGLRLATFSKVVDSDIVAEAVKAMKFTTKDGGTAPSANIWGYSEAGKTGTSMKIINGAYSNQKHVATFVGFSPVNNPAFVLLVTMDEPFVGYVPGRGKNHMGGICCAPVFREIGRRSLEYLGIPPDDPYGYPTGDPRRDPKKADWYPETEKLKGLYQSWNR